MLNANDIKTCFQGLLTTLRSYGCNVFKPEDINDVIIFQNRNEAIVDTLTRAADRAIQVASAGSRGAPVENVDMVFCILMGSDDTYSKIKYVAETHLCLMTQCMLQKNIRNCKRSYMQNLALKVNVKLDGVNHFLNVSQELPRITEARAPTMLIGFDITNPGGTAPGMGSMPSIVSAVGSMDPRYYCQHVC
jgi:hypothetical protein